MPLKLKREPDLKAKHEGFVYQVAAVDAIKDLEFAAVFHEQGLGKTKIGVDLCLTWLKQGIVDSILIVTKKGLIKNWCDEIKIHSSLKPRILGQDRRSNFYAFNSPARVYLTHYEVLRSEEKRLQLFLKTRRVAIILDESHKIKNPDSHITKVLFELAPDFSKRIIMTGTPVANRPYDLWAQIYFLDQGVSLGRDFTGFRAELDLSNDLAMDPQKQAIFEDSLAKVFHKISRFAFRETKKNANIKLPGKEITNVYVDLEARQEEIYKTYRQELSAIVVKRGRPLLDDAEEILKRLTRLVQVASNPKLVDESYEGVPGKLPVLESLLGQIVDSGEKAIVWTAFIENVDWLTRQLQSLGTAKVHGKLSYDARGKSIENFKTREDIRVLIATPASSKEGLTLTVANHAIFYDRSFSLDDYLQAQDRIHRISQTKDCFVTNLVAKDSIDEWVDALLAAKGLAAQLGQGDITREQYDANVSYDFGEIVREILGVGTEGT